MAHVLGAVPTALQGAVWPVRPQDVRVADSLGSLPGSVPHPNLSTMTHSLWVKSGNTQYGELSWDSERSAFYLHNTASN